MEQQFYSLYIPFFDKLTKEEQIQITKKSERKHVKKHTIIHNGNEDCLGVIIVVSGQLRSYTMSREGKQITLYRLFSHDACLFSASCTMSNIQFEVIIEALEDTEFIIIPANLYRQLVQTSLVVSQYANQLMASHFTDVMWVMEQVLNKSFDSRLAAFLAEEIQIREKTDLQITHDEIAKHLGTAREVVTRMLKYFQMEGIVELSRGHILIKNEQKLLHM